MNIGEIKQAITYNNINQKTECNTNGTSNQTKEEQLDLPIEDKKTVNASQIMGYYPNIITNNKNFDTQFKNATKFSDASAILKPTICGSSSLITRNEDGTYTVKKQPTVYGAKAKYKTMTEVEIMADKSLCSGTLKQNDDGTYNINYVHRDAITGELIPVRKESLTSEEVSKLLQTESIHMQ